MFPDGKDMIPMLRLVYDHADEGDSIPFPVHRVVPRGRLVVPRSGDDPANQAQRALEDAQAQLDDLRELMDFSFVSEDDGPKAA